MMLLNFSPEMIPELGWV